MLKEKNYLFSRLNQLLDVLVVIAAFFVSLWSRNALLVPNFFPTEPIIAVNQHHWLIWIMAVVVLVMQGLLGVYNSQRLRGARHLIIPIGVSCLVAAVVALGLTVVGPGLRIISKPQVIYMALWMFLLLVIKAALIKRFFLPSVAEA
ncbi:hypothetical protein JXA47_07920 [Candidatus Sumerlaeota bacterium]|nr:hypothetical protein [Candidatus Sumerlaeota bacterium]